jgi:hypothetical protein
LPHNRISCDRNIYWLKSKPLIRRVAGSRSIVDFLSQCHYEVRK